MKIVSQVIWRIGLEKRRAVEKEQPHSAIVASSHCWTFVLNSIFSFAEICWCIILMMIFFGEIAAHSTKHWQRGKVSFLKRKYKNKNKLKFQKPHFYVKSHHKSQNRLLFLATDLASVRASLWLSGKHTHPTWTRNPSSLKWDYSRPDLTCRLGGVVEEPIFGLCILLVR